MTFRVTYNLEAPDIPGGADALEASSWWPADCFPKPKSYCLAVTEHPPACPHSSAFSNLHPPHFPFWQHLSLCSGILPQRAFLPLPGLYRPQTQASCKGRGLQTLAFRGMLGDDCPKPPRFSSGSLHILSLALLGLCLSSPRGDKLHGDTGAGGIWLRIRQIWG